MCAAFEVQVQYIIWGISFVNRKNIMVLPASFYMTAYSQAKRNISIYTGVINHVQLIYRISPY